MRCITYFLEQRKKETEIAQDVNICSSLISQIICEKLLFGNVNFDYLFIYLFEFDFLWIFLPTKVSSCQKSGHAAAGVQIKCRVKLLALTSC